MKSYTWHVTYTNKDGAPPRKRVHPSGTIWNEEIVFHARYWISGIQWWWTCHFRRALWNYGKPCNQWRGLFQKVFAKSNLCTLWEQSIDNFKEKQPLIVTLTSNVKHLINNAHSKMMDNFDDMDLLIKVVGTYIRNEIKNAQKDNIVCPDASEIKSLEHNISTLTPVLLLLLQTIIMSKRANLRCASIGQAIMSSTCPRAFICPPQIGCV